VNVSRLDEETFLLSGLDPFLVEILRQLPAAATVGTDDAASQRLYPNPADESEPQTNEEWRQYVTPELRRLFESATETLTSDLGNIAPLEGDADRLAVPIPQDHSDAWLNALNQARLALAARHAVTEADMDAKFPLIVRSDRDFALLQIHFYGLLQEFLIEALSDGL
jgi:hypothetical protein